MRRQARGYPKWVRIYALTAMCIVAGGFGASTAAQDCASNAVFSGPLVINKGGTYTGNWQSNDSATPAVHVITTQPVTIVNSRLKGPGELLNTGIGSKVTVRESCFVGVNPNVLGQAKGSAIHTFEAASVLVENSEFNGTGGSGVWVQRYGGDRSSDQTVRIRNNRFLNIDGRKSDGQGGYLTNVASPSHAIILTDFSGVPGTVVEWNQIVNEPYQSGVGDSINIFDASGTASSPMQIRDNFIQGGWDSDPVNGDALMYFGSAFTTDGNFQTDPNLTVAFIKVHHNQAVGFGNLGMSISLGHDIEMYANRVISDGLLGDGTVAATSYSIGIQHLNWRTNPPGVFGNNSIHDNISGTRKRRNGVFERQDYYFPIPPTTAFNNASWVPTGPSDPTGTDEAHEFLLWQEKLIANHIVIGSQLAPPIQGSLDIVSGNNQTASPNTMLPSPITVRARGPTNAPLAGVHVAFMISTGNGAPTQHFAVTDADGLASTTVSVAVAPGPVQVMAIAAVSPTGAAVATINAHIGFTDDPLVAGATTIQGVHLTELRARVDALRVRFGLAAFTWTDTTLPGVLVRSVHISELRAALADAYAAAKTTAPVYSDPILTPGISIKAAHIAELRAAIVALEN